MADFARLYQLLFDEYGQQNWWPAQSRFEIMVGALLVQRTTWSNAEKAVARLTERQLLDPISLVNAHVSEVEPCIRCAGFYRMKAQRLQRLAQFVADAGGTDSLAGWSTGKLRSALLDLPGIGAETAAAILLYAFGRPAVVIDAYLRRLVQRLRAASSPDSDTSIEQAVLAYMTDAQSLNDWHALVVEHGKRVCLPKPRCGDCCLKSICQTAEVLSDA